MSDPQTTQCQIRFHNGLMMPIPEQRVREYAAIDIYEGYDDCHSVNNDIGRQDVDSANCLRARMEERTIRTLLAASSNFSPLLAPIPNRDLDDVDEGSWRTLRPRIATLIQAMMTIPWVNTAVSTKILHLKRPKLIPILDSYVVGFLSEEGTPDSGGRFGVSRAKEADLRRGMVIFDRIRSDMIANKPCLMSVEQKLGQLALTRVRIYDILAWTMVRWDRMNDFSDYASEPKTLIRKLPPSHEPAK